MTLFEPIHNTTKIQDMWGQIGRKLEGRESKKVEFVSKRLKQKMICTFVPPTSIDQPNEGLVDPLVAH